MYYSKVCPLSAYRLLLQIRQVPRVILERLRTAGKIQSALASPKLQELIRTIDSSRSRGWALHRQLEQNADFRQFVNDMLDTIDFKQ